MNKLVQNELIKILKRKNIYILLIILIIIIVFYNYINPNQNAETLKIGTRDKNIKMLEQNLEKYGNDMEEYINKKTDIDFSKLYNRYEKESWQRYALNDENLNHVIGNTQIGVYQDIREYMEIINKYELNKNNKITEENYKKAKEKLVQYIKTLDSNQWEEYIRLKINNLEEAKNNNLISNERIQKINLEIEIYQLRLKHDIEYGNDEVLNQYIEQYRKQFYMLEYLQSSKQNNAADNQSIQQCKAKIALTRYAIENNIKQDISPENFNLIYDNKVDARNSFIKTFESFEIIIVIIALYISCTTIVEETNRGTIKNLLIKPHQRSTIIISKIFACIIVLILAMLFVIIAQYVVGGLIFGFDSYGLDFIGYDYKNEQIITMNLFKYLILVGIFKLPMYIIIITFCIFMGVINNNISMTMILTVIVFVISNSVITEWSKNVGVSIITRFFITNNWDFSKYLFGQISDINGVNSLFSFVMCMIYESATFGILIKKFNVKEIKNV